jgi:hypothetical protein
MVSLRGVRGLYFSEWIRLRRGKSDKVSGSA